MPRLPLPLAVHWELSGRPDGFSSATSLLWPLMMGLALSTTVTWTVLRVRRASGSLGNLHWLVGISGGVSAFLVSTMVGVAGLQRDVPDARHVNLPMWFLPACLGVATLIAASTAAATPRYPSIQARTLIPVLHLQNDERVLWWKAANAPWAGALLLVAGPLVTGGVALLALGPAPSMLTALSGIALFLVAGLFVSVSAWQVRVSGDGVVVRSWLGVWRFRVGLEEIASARSTEVNALGEFGGWGLRWAKRKRIGIIVRSGEALEVVRKNGSSLVITVSDATSAAAVINGLIDQKSRTDS